MCSFSVFSQAGSLLQFRAAPMELGAALMSSGGSRALPSSARRMTEARALGGKQEQSLKAHN